MLQERITPCQQTVMLKLQWCNLDSFTKMTSKKFLKRNSNIGSAIEIMAKAEGLQAHKMQLHYD
jgi:histidinol dehydrogenase